MSDTMGEKRALKDKNMTVALASPVKKAKFQTLDINIESQTALSVDEGIIQARSSAQIDVKPVQHDVAPVALAKSSKPSAKPKKPTISGKGKSNRRKSGSLKKLLEVPVEIFSEVSFHLSPKDLLNMARASHSLRDFFMSKKSKAVWQAAREGMGIPECPSDLSEPQYADLLFGVGCSVCDTPRARADLYVEFRLRLCQKCSCRKNNGQKILERVHDSDTSLNVLLSCVPHQAILQIHVSLESHVEKFVIEKNLNDRVFYEPHFLQVLQIYDNLAPGSKEQNRFVEERQKLTSEVMNNTLKVKRWLRKEISRLEMEKQTIKIERHLTIMERLEDLGYTEDDLDDSYDNENLGKRWHRLMYAPRELNERTWKPLLPKLQELIERRRELHETLDWELDMGCGPDRPFNGCGSRDCPACGPPGWF